MAETTNKPKLQMRSGASFNDKVKSPSIKLMINHGKPNFTIQRSPKVQQNGEGNPLSPKSQNGLNGNSSNSNGDSAFKNANGSTEKNIDRVVKSTKFNGVFRPANLPVTQSTVGENEATKVVLRRVQVPDTTSEEGVDDSVPEFIRKQRKIQERLAKDNILDFENRRSGYFTQVMISPTLPNRTSFVETMSSPAIVPALEIPPPLPAKNEEKEEKEEKELVTAVAISNDISNDHVEEEEVAKAIEEVNKAVAGEDDDKVESELEVEVVAVATKAVDDSVAVAVETVAQVTASTPETPETTKVPEEEVSPTNGQVGAIVTSLMIDESVIADPNVDSNQNEKDVTISHTNGFDGPSIPTPDPSGSLGVNFEPKTIVSFSKDLSSEPNKYPDTVKVTNENGPGSNSSPVDEELQEMAKLKFQIKADEEDVQVTPVLRSE